MALGIPVDLFLAGDHRKTFSALSEQVIECDIILSRNVIEPFGYTVKILPAF